jgi:mRNA interferase HicA
MKLRDVEKHLRANGCMFFEHGAKHDAWVNPANNMHTTVPRHREIPFPTVLSICKQLQIPLRAEDDQATLFLRSSLNHFARERWSVRMASRAITNASSTVRACVVTPGSIGVVTAYQPFLASSKTRTSLPSLTVYFLAIVHILAAEKAVFKREHMTV